MNVVSSTLILASATIETREQKIPRKLLHIFFLDMRTILVDVFACKTEVYKVDICWVTISNKNVFKLQIVVDEAYTIDVFDPVNLYKEKNEILNWF